jgi:hypothetical protein
MNKLKAALEKLNPANMEKVKAIVMKYQGNGLEVGGLLALSLSLALSRSLSLSLALSFSRSLVLSHHDQIARQCHLLIMPHFVWRTTLTRSLPRVSLTLKVGLALQSEYKPAHLDAPAPARCSFFKT